MRPETWAAVGPLTIAALAGINVDVAFLGTNALSFQRGLTTPDADEALVKHQMLAAARQRVFLVDTSKFGRENFARHATLADIDVLVTDDAISAQQRERLRRGRRHRRGGPMITTVTPNPSLDRTLHLSRFVPGHVNRATATMVEPSGKGVNVALALHGVGVPVRAVLPVGGPAGHEIAVLLDDLGLDHVDVPIAGTPRSNISLVEADGRTSKVNEPGPQLSEAEVDALCAKALSRQRYR